MFDKHFLSILGITDTFELNMIHQKKFESDLKFDLTNEKKGNTLKHLPQNNQCETFPGHNNGSELSTAVQEQTFNKPLNCSRLDTKGSMCGSCDPRKVILRAEERTTEVISKNKTIENGKEPAPTSDQNNEIRLTSVVIQTPSEHNAIKDLKYRQPKEINNCLNPRETNTTKKSQNDKVNLNLNHDQLETVSSFTDTSVSPKHADTLSNEINLKRQKIIRERSQQNRVIFELVMNRLQHKKKLNTEKRLNNIINNKNANPNPQLSSDTIQSNKNLKPLEPQSCNSEPHLVPSRSVNDFFKMKNVNLVPIKHSRSVSTLLGKKASQNDEMTDKNKNLRESNPGNLKISNVVSTKT